MLDASSDQELSAPSDIQSVPDSAPSDVAAMIAHEMTTSLGALRGHAAVLASCNLDSEVAGRARTAIQREAELLSVLVADLQATAIGNVPFAVRLKPVAIEALLADVAMVATALAGQQHSVSTIIETQARVWADVERIGQVLRNLLSNAAKYSQPGTPIEVRALPHGQRVRIEVSDQGVGIPVEETDFIFGKYHRGAGHATRVGGQGLGLYVARRIVEAHGGELRVESAPNQGSTFAFELEIVV